MSSANRKSGSALLLALVTVVVLSTLMVTFLFRVHMESDLAIRSRFGMKAEVLAEAGQEYGKWMVIQSVNTGNEADDDRGETFFVAAKNLQRGVALTGYRIDMEDGFILLSITPESSRRNVNRLSDPDWEQLLENSGVPEREHAKLISAFRDWTDEDETSRLLGAEEDDSYYQDLELPVKDGPIENLSELGMIRGFTSAILYGGTLEDYYDKPEVDVSGILGTLSVYGDETISLNAATRDVLLSLSGIREEQVDQILEGRAGNDGELGTEDDGFSNVEQGLAAASLSGDTQSLFSVSDLRFVRITSIGEVGGIRKGTLAIYEFTGSEMTLLSYQESDL